MTNCVFQIRRGGSRVIGIQQVDPRASDPWRALHDSLQLCADRFKAGPGAANDAGVDETFVTDGVLHMIVRTQIGSDKSRGV